jgi:hypothetical protein
MLARSMPFEQKIGHDPFEFLIFVPERSHFAQLAQGDAIVLVAPTVKRGLRDAQFTANLDGGRSILDLPERPHDLLFTEFAWSHRLISSFS